MKQTDLIAFQHFGTPPNGKPVTAMKHRGSVVAALVNVHFDATPAPACRRFRRPAWLVRFGLWLAGPEVWD